MTGEAGLENGKIGAKKENIGRGAITGGGTSRRREAGGRRDWKKGEKRGEEEMALIEGGGTGSIVREAEGRERVGTDKREIKKRH